MREREIGRQGATVIAQARFGAGVALQNDGLLVVSRVRHGDAGEAGSERCRVMSAHEKGFPEKEESSSFLKKRTKKLLFLRRLKRTFTHLGQDIKVFWFFFSKKNCFLSPTSYSPDSPH
jgi:hypothetical protein